MRVRRKTLMSATPVAMGVLSMAACGDAQEARATAAGGAELCPGVAGETVRWIVTTPAGGSLDVGSRLLEPFYEAALGAEIVVENRPGAGGRIGARAIRDAEPDGRTLGIVNGTAFLAASLSEDVEGIHPLRDFTVLGRLATEDPVWVRGPSSRYRTIEEALASRDDPILVGITDVGGSSFVFVSVPSELLGLDIRYVPGYPGIQEYMLGLLRGEIDFAAIAFESLRDRIEAGELTPVLQLSDRPVAEHPSLEGVPLLAGPDGVAARVARARGAEAEGLARTAALIRLFGIGRLVVGPRGLPPELAGCLASRLAEVAADPALHAAAARARRIITFAGPAELTREVQLTEEDLTSLASVVRRHVALVRGAAPVR
jgi:tripartite-type tricarboxylate transporter receptor subunit TctC